MSDADERGFEIDSPTIHVKAGPQRIAAAFVPRFVGPVDDLMMPIDHTLVDTRIGTGFGITSAPHIQDLVIAGPMKVTGISDTPSRRKVFTCRPTAPDEERGCATDTVRRLATQAFRGPVGAADMADLMKFYDQGRTDSDFENGVRMAVQGILANPRFLFRVEQQPEVPAGSSYRISDLELASRLSFFIWGTVPDAELVKVATAGTLKTTAGLDRQVRRMLADPKAEALATRFGAQWLRLQDVDKMRPDGILYPQWDQSLTDSMREETELFFASLVREDRSVLDLLNADYTFVNERLARHYGFPNVTGTEFRRVTLPPTRRGVLTQGSILMMTSVADRTSPVQRGKWVMQVMLGSPPPPPPPNVPALEETGGSKDGKVLSVRERMEEHRKNPACTSCHRVIDPLGLALEHFDVTGQYRIKDNGVPVDATGDALRRQPDGRARRVAPGAAEVQGRHAGQLHREPDDLRARPPRRIVRHADDARHRARRRPAGLQDVGVRPGRGQEPGLPDEPPDPDRDYRRRRPSVGAAMFITRKNLSRRTVLKGIGVTAALPLLEAMVPAGTAQARTAAAGKVRLVCIEMVHGAAGSTAFGLKMNMWSPAATGRDFDLYPSALSPLEPVRQHITIVSNTDLRQAEAFTTPEIGGDHFRASAVFLTQAHPKQTMGSDVQAGISIDQLYAQRFGQDTPIPSMQLCIEHGRPGRRLRVRLLLRLHRLDQLGDAETPLPMIRDPRTVFDQLFGGRRHAPRSGRRAARRIAASSTR